jgi:hypothetical protein
MKWIKDTTPNSNGEVLYLGPWVVGSVSVHYDSLCSKDDVKKYVAMYKLPGFERRGEFRLKKDAKVAVESAVEYWLSLLPQQ